MNIIKILVGEEGYKETPEKIIDFIFELSCNSSGKEINSSSVFVYEIKTESSDIIYSNTEIYEESHTFFNQNNFNVFLGGKREISYPLVRAFKENNLKNKKESCLIIFDCYSGLVSKDSSFGWLYNLIESGFKPKNILIVGNRENSLFEKDFIRENKISSLAIDRFYEDLDNAVDSIMEFSFGKELYLSIDLSILDPLFCPACKSNVCGISSGQLLYSINRMKNMKNLKAIDLTNIDSSKDKEDITLKTGAKIISEFVH